MIHYKFESGQAKKARNYELAEQGCLTAAPRVFNILGRHIDESSV